MNDLLLLTFIFLIAGVVAVPLSVRTGLGSVLGYLIAGIIISPVLKALHVDVIAIQHIAEFGVVMMLFLVGLELEPVLLWRMRHKLLGLGGLQVSLTTLSIMAIALYFGQTWQIALAVGFVLALSSTAIVLQTLNEKGLMNSEGGKSSFSVLLMQDIAVIPILALLPLLAAPDLTAETLVSGAYSGSGDDGHGVELNLISGLHGGVQMLAILGVVGGIILLGRVLARPIFRYIAWARLMELFTAAALLFVVAIALSMVMVGLSPALGAFIAGVVLANNEYKHELESHIQPFRGLLLGVFFMTVGASINFALLASSLGLILTMTFGVMMLKGLILFVLALIFRVQGSQKWLFAFSLAQAGEFGFVLLSFSTQNNIIPQAIADQLLLVVALSMLLTPLLFIAYESFLAPRYANRQSNIYDEIEPEGGIIIAGYGRFGGIINRMLRGVGYETTVLDFSSEQLELIRTFGFKVFFGDATRPDMLHAAGIEKAKLFIIAIDNRSQITEMTRYVCKTYPHVHVVARAVSRPHVYELYEAGAHDIIREVFDSSVRAGRSALEALGIERAEAERLSQRFVDEDRAALRQLAEVFQIGKPLSENPEYVRRSRKIMEEQAAELRGEHHAIRGKVKEVGGPSNVDRSSESSQQPGDEDIK